MGELSVHFLEDSIDIGEDGKLIGRIPRQSVDSEGLALLKRENQLRMGTVNYQSWVAGVLSGVTLLFGPPHPVDVLVEPPENGTQVPMTFDGMLPGEPVANEDPAATTVASPAAAETLPQNLGEVLAISPELQAAAATVADPASPAPTP